MAKVRRRGSSRRPAASLAGAAAVTAAAGTVLFLAGREAAQALGRLPPPETELHMRLALAAAQLPTHKVTVAELESARRRAIADPLAYQPFFVAARAAEQRGRLKEAIRLMEEARRRRPSHVTTRVMLMGYYGLSGRYQEAISEAGVAMRLYGKIHTAILPVLAGMLAHPEGRGALAAVLARNPEWREAFAEAAKPRTGAADAADLLARVRERRPSSGVMPEAALLVSSLMREQRYAEARRVWLAYVPAEGRTNGFVFDGDFRGLPAPPPFGWTYPNSSAGRAGPAKAGPNEPPYLHVSFFGDAPATLAEQALVLPPGRYRLSLLARADRRDLPGEILWRIGCLPAKNEVARLTMRSFAEKYRSARLEFTIPAGCRAQMMTLVAEPGDLAQPINAQFTRVKVDPLA